MRASLFATTFALACGQDLFLGKQDVDQEMSLASRRRSGRSASKHGCVKTCLAEDEQTHFKQCNHDGSDSCAESKCCELEGNTCFVKNAYWSACLKHCKTGIPDAMGETWDCTALSPSSCTSLKPCVEGCWDSEPESLELQANATADWDCKDYTDKADCIAHHTSPTDDNLNKMWEKVCNDNCPDAPATKCPASSFTQCISNCAGDSLAPEHGDGCEDNGATSCLSSRCCKNPSDTCYTKNQYWAACTSTCTKGETNPLDGQIWDCQELKPRTTCDPYLYRSCVSTCSSEC